MVYQSFALTLAALALLITPSLGQLNTVCNPGGTMGSCADFITTFCTSIASEVIGPGDSAQRCFTTSTPTLKCDFTALNTHNVSSGISVTNCENALQSVNATCPLGGWGQVSGAPFRFFGDPNTGPCRGSCGN
ncbi:hypothetical protein DFH08DRAFT_1084516 [Mycena albidolilacea]|uniref:Glycan binding protein Y3-like domain-containing protein n=1 Tax=Mycena albidolilacea TaxID=1033008 RepID=A0AAD6ZLZ1_9AGAR|nr:hypothetical protein DFH08DRAFT_1084516 [Mycena albidolilacea]